MQFSPGRGETGVDLSAIPVDAIKRVEILRDGASAQYGSDAIAGVMNVILKDRYEYSTLNLRAGTSTKGDDRTPYAVAGNGRGDNYGLSFNSGANYGEKGFLNYTIDLSQQESAIRSGKVDLATESPLLAAARSKMRSSPAFWAITLLLEISTGPVKSLLENFS